MAVPQKRAELVAALTTQREALLKLLDGMSSLERVSPLAPGTWSAQEMVVHLSYWEHVTLGNIRDTFKLGRPTPLPPESAYDDLNGRALQQRKGWSWERIRAEFVNTRNALIERIGGLSESDLQFQVPSPWINDLRIVTLATMLREDVLDHTGEHLRELEQWQVNH